MSLLLWGTPQESQSLCLWILSCLEYKAWNDGSHLSTMLKVTPECTRGRKQEDLRKQSWKHGLKSATEPSPLLAVGMWVHTFLIIKAAFEFLSLSPSMLCQTAQAAITNTVAWAFKQQEFVSSLFWTLRNLRSECQLLVRALFSLCPHRAERRRESKQTLWCLSL